MTDTAIKWTRRMRPRKADQGHSMRRYGEQRVAAYKYRSYILCECGKMMSSGSASAHTNAAYYGYTRHLKNEGVSR